MRATLAVLACLLLGSCSCEPVASGLRYACADDQPCAAGFSCLEGWCIVEGSLPRTDAGTVDAGTVDAGTVDAGTVDAGTVDAGVVDAGMVDAGMVDAGMVDAGMVDAGTVDAGTVDAGCVPSAEVCTDGVDNDCDHFIDCDDINCQGRLCGANGQTCTAGYCTCPGNFETCDDGIDNDCNGLKDCTDPVCGSALCDPSGSTSSLCASSVCVCSDTYCGPNFHGCLNSLVSAYCPGLGCINVSTSMAHCGACGLTCASGRSCQQVDVPLVGVPGVLIKRGRCSCGTTADCGTLGQTCSSGVCVCNRDAQCGANGFCDLIAPDAGVCAPR